MVASELVVRINRCVFSPDGTIQLPGVGSVPAQGLTLAELKYEVDERYTQFVNGIEVTPRLSSRAPRFVFVVGEVRRPDRHVLEGPTTVYAGDRIGRRLEQRRQIERDRSVSTDRGLATDRDEN